MIVQAISYGEVNTARLPKEYQGVIYIQSSGTQYIDTGFKPNQDTRVVCKAICPVSTSTNWLFGVRNGNASAEFGFVASASGYYLACYNTSQVQFANSYNSSGTIDVDNNKGITIITANGITSSVTGVSGTFNCNYNLVLFGGNTAGSVTCGTNTIYSCQIYDNGTLVRDFVPCYRISDTVIGLYDLVNDVFYTNAGTGTFIKGNSAGYEEKTLLTYTGSFSDTRVDGIGDVTLNTSGTLTVTGESKIVSVYILGGGGGGAQQAFGSSRSGSGGGGGNQTVQVELSEGTYEIVIGSGGEGKYIASASGTAGTGGSTTAFGYTSTGGTGGTASSGSSGGTGGTPNGGNGSTGSTSGGSPNGGASNGGSADANSGGDGLVRITFS